MFDACDQVYEIECIFSDPEDNAENFGMLSKDGMLDMRDGDVGHMIVLPLCMYQLSKPCEDASSNRSDFINGS